MMSAIDKFTSNTINQGEKSKQGMTLVEVLIALLILAVVLGGNAALFTKCNIFAAELKEQTIVNYALNEGMEEIRNMSYDFILNSLGPSFSAEGCGVLNNATCSLAKEDSFTDDNSQKITLTVDWDSFQGRTLSKSLSAYFTRDGISG